MGVNEAQQPKASYLCKESEGNQSISYKFLTGFSVVSTR